MTKSLVSPYPLIHPVSPSVMDSKILLPLVLTMWVGAQPVQATSPGATPPSEAASAPGVEIAPMSDAAIMGAACLGLATATMAAAYTIGPVETMMLISGSPIVPNSTVLFIPMFGVLGGGSCALAAAATPGVRWMINQSGKIAGHLVAWIEGWLSDHHSGEAPGPAIGAGGPAGRPLEKAASDPPPVRPMTETELQSTGCLVGALTGFTASMATSPMEVAMLSSGTTVIVSSTPVLGLGLLATVVGAGCGIGSLVSIPVMEFVDHFNTIGNNLFDAIEQEVAWITDGAIPHAMAGETGRVSTAMQLPRGLP